MGSAERVVVVDVETTGLGRTDRVVEIAIITLDEHGQIRDEFETLVNPHRDVGPTWIHGLTPTMLTDAPSFDDIAVAVAARLDGAVVVAHNISFDTRMIGSELTRAGIDIRWGTGLDTLAVTGRKLAAACRDHAVILHGAHCAANDARATASLLLAVADRFATAGKPAHTGICSVGSTQLVARAAGAFVHEPAPYLVELASDIHLEPDVADYAVLLDQALADLQLSAAERAELEELARDSGLSAADIARAHRGFLNDLIDTALDDGIVTDDEIDRLVRVAALLNLDPHVVATRTNPFRFTDDVVSLEPGLTVCFTGDGDTAGRALPRAELHAIATAHGLTPVDAVTSKGCGLLVAADPATLSGKAKAARKFGIPIAALDDFLTAATTSTGLPVTVLRRHGVASVCEQCGDSWTATRRTRVCPPCRRAPSVRASAAGPPTSIVGTDILVCIDCSRSWERPRARGRRPHRCPDCAAAVTA
ncbi:exonuclease domain-containing protein [Gordonia hankookensis]|nr:exonuclease domain-containing protein [Gordonia hankookensis]